MNSVALNCIVLAPRGLINLPAQCTAQPRRAVPIKAKPPVPRALGRDRPAEQEASPKKKETEAPAAPAKTMASPSPYGGPWSRKDVYWRKSVCLNGACVPLVTISFAPGANKTKSRNGSKRCSSQNEGSCTCTHVERYFEGFGSCLFLFRFCFIPVLGSWSMLEYFFLPMIVMGCSFDGG